MPQKSREQSDNERSPEETERIREETLKRILGTPPRPHKDMIAERKAKRRGAGPSGRTKVTR